MAIRGKLNRVNRTVALALALVWFGAGIACAFYGFHHGQLLLLVLSLLAIWYALAWFRVFTQSRLLTTWREFLTPWR